MAKGFNNQLAEQFKSLMYNRWVLYFLFVLSFGNIVYLGSSNDFGNIFIFALIGFLTTFFSKNMVVILCIALVFSSLIHYGTGMKYEGFELTRSDKTKITNAVNALIGDESNYSLDYSEYDNTETEDDEELDDEHEEGMETEYDESIEEEGFNLMEGATPNKKAIKPNLQKAMKKKAENDYQNAMKKKAEKDSQRAMIEKAEKDSQRGMIEKAKVDSQRAMIEKAEKDSQRAMIEKDAENQKYMLDKAKNDYEKAIVEKAKNDIQNAIREKDMREKAKIDIQNAIRDKIPVSTKDNIVRVQPVTRAPTFGIPQNTISYTASPTTIAYTTAPTNSLAPTAPTYGNSVPSFDYNTEVSAIAEQIAAPTNSLAPTEQQRVWFSR